MSEQLSWRAGGCHCGAVRFEVRTPPVVEVEDCNCTMCAKTGFLHLIVPANRFRLVSGMDRIVTYVFNTGTAKHLFCAVCGSASTCAASMIRRASMKCASWRSTAVTTGRPRRKPSPTSRTRSHFPSYFFVSSPACLTQLSRSMRPRNDISVLTQSISCCVQAAIWS